MHPRKRKIAIVLLSIGTLVGFGSGFASMRHRACARRDAFEKHIADVCVDAARREGGEQAHAAAAVDRDDALADAIDSLDADDLDGESDGDHDGRGHGRRHGSDNLR